jgi:hypothetical protein
LTSGSQIGEAIQNIRGTLVTHLEPNRSKRKKVETLAGIAELYEWYWPCEGEYSGFIQARKLPHIGNFINFSPSKINKIISAPLEKPEPNFDIHTSPKAQWSIPVPNILGILI